MLEKRDETQKWTPLIRILLIFKENALLKSHGSLNEQIIWKERYLKYTQGTAMPITIIPLFSFNISRVKPYNPTFIQYRTTIRISCFSKQRKSVLHKTERSFCRHLKLEGKYSSFSGEWKCVRRKIVYAHTSIKRIS